MKLSVSHTISNTSTLSSVQVTQYQTPAHETQCIVTKEQAALALSVNHTRSKTNNTQCMSHDNKDQHLPCHETGLSLPERYFTDRSKAALLLWIIVFLCLAFLMPSRLLPCGHLLGIGWPLCSCWRCLLYFCYFPM